MNCDQQEDHCDKQNLTKHKAVIYGGNGFVGTRVAERLANADYCAVCLSRTGYKPLHLQNEDWSKSVRWCKGDASAPDTKLLARTEVLISLVGSAPLPTFSKQAYERQVFDNGTTNVNVIKAAADAGIKRLVLVSANIPWFMRTSRFGYAKGKQMAYEAAQSFSELSDEHSALVLRPSVIAGKRYLSSGKCLHLDTVLSPISKLTPSQVTCINRLSNRIADAVLKPEDYQGKFIVVEPKAI